MYADTPLLDKATLPWTLPLIIARHFQVRVHQHAHERLAVEVVGELQAARAPHVREVQARVRALPCSIVRRVAAAQLRPSLMVNAAPLRVTCCEVTEQPRPAESENECDQCEDERQLPVRARRPVLRGRRGQR